ncbi:MAG TPA: CoA transferase, partial [Steroidobacteraceae bacterium]|nr:CoA transferase [Steroidobacteraceae bacterium]
MPEPNEAAAVHAGAGKDALAGIKVLDFGQMVSAPYCAKLFSDFGADVIKVEPPEGESSRRWGTARFGAAGDTSGLFLALNRNKAAITLDLKSPEGAAAVDALVREADVVMESFKPGVADRLGIGYEQLRAIKPDLVYVSVSGFGQNGPLREAPGYDQLLQAFSG